MCIYSSDGNSLISELDIYFADLWKWVVTMETDRRPTQVKKIQPGKVSQRVSLEAQHDITACFEQYNFRLYYYSYYDVYL